MIWIIFAMTADRYGEWQSRHDGDMIYDAPERPHFAWNDSLSSWNDRDRGAQYQRFWEEFHTDVETKTSQYYIISFFNFKTKNIAKLIGLLCGRPMAVRDRHRHGKESVWWLIELLFFHLFHSYLFSHWLIKNSKFETCFLHHFHSSVFSTVLKWMLRLTHMRQI